MPTAGAEVSVDRLEGTDRALEAAFELARAQLATERRLVLDVDALSPRTHRMFFG